MAGAALLLVCFNFIAILMAGVEGEKTQKLEWYMHDIVGGKNATTVLVAGPNGNVTVFNAFGSIIVIDDLLTEGPSPSSKLVGRAQGIYVGDSLSKLSLLFSITAVLPEGTISFHGQDPILDDVRELAVVGGTNAYRFIRGYAELRTYFFNATSGSAIIKFDVYFK